MMMMMMVMTHGFVSFGEGLCYLKLRLVGSKYMS